MTDIYKTPEAELTDTPARGEYGSLERGIAGEFNFSIGDIIRESWSRTKGNKGKAWLAAFLYIVIAMPITFGIPLLLEALGMPTKIEPGQPLTPGIGLNIFFNQFVVTTLTIPLAAGLYMVGVKLSAGAPVTAAEVVRYYPDLLRLLVTVILMYLFIVLGLLLFVIPGVYLMFAYYFAVPLVVDKGLSPWRALESSRKAITTCWFRFVGLLIVLGLIMLVGTIPLGLGLIWVVPLMLIAIGMAYRNMFGLSKSTG